VRQLLRSLAAVWRVARGFWRMPNRSGTETPSGLGVSVPLVLRVAGLGPSLPCLLEQPRGFRVLWHQLEHRLKGAGRIRETAAFESLLPLGHLLADRGLHVPWHQAQRLLVGVG